MKELIQNFRSLLHILRGSPIERATQALSDAVKDEARFQAEVHYESLMARFFDSEARSLDPHRDWNHFANLKNKWHEHQQSFVKEERRLKQASARALACRERLEQLRAHSGEIEGE